MQYYAPMLAYLLIKCCRPHSRFWHLKRWVSEMLWNGVIFRLCLGKKYLSLGSFSLSTGWLIYQTKSFQGQFTTRFRRQTVRYSTSDVNVTYSPRPKLYFVKVDVQACFDTIEQRELLRIIDKLISEVLSLTRIGSHTPLLELQDVYMIQRYGQVGMSAGRPRRTFVRRATDGMLFHSFC